MSSQNPYAKVYNERERAEPKLRTISSPEKKKKKSGVDIKKKQLQEWDKINHEPVSTKTIDEKERKTCEDGKGPQIPEKNVHVRMKKIEMELYRLRKGMGELQKETKALNDTIKLWMQMMGNNQPPPQPPPSYPRQLLPSLYTPPPPAPPSYPPPPSMRLPPPSGHYYPYSNC